MQPHHTMLGVPTSTKPKRRTVHLRLADVDRKTKCSPDQVHIREMTVAQGGLGCAIWDGSIVLARWMHAHADECFRGRVGMELGAGVGVPGIVAARYAARVVLTDYMEEVVANLAYNLKLNANVDQEDEDDECRDEVELARRRAMRQNVRASGSSALLDFHAIDPDEEDLQRMEESRTEAAAAASAAASSSSSSAAASSSAAPSVDGAAALSSRLSGLPFVPSVHFVDPTGLGPASCDFLVGAELIYTHNRHHQACFLKILQYYLKKGGRYYCVQSRNREGMPTFVADLLLTNGFTVHWQAATPESGLTGGYRTEKVPKGFVQREEEYIFYVIQWGEADEASATANPPIATLSLPGGTLQSAADVPVPQVNMLRDGEQVLKEGAQIELTDEAKKLVQQLLPKAFAQTQQPEATADSSSSTHAK